MVNSPTKLAQTGTQTHNSAPSRTTELYARWNMDWETLKISGGWLRQSWWVWREREKRNENETVAKNICIKVLVCVVIVLISLDKYLGVKFWRSANQNHNKVSPHTSQKSYHQNSTNNKCWTGCGKRESYYTVGGNVNWYSHYGEQYGGGVV